MSDNLREKRDEKELDFGASSTEPWPYLSFMPKNGRESRVLKFVIIDDMPTIVTLCVENDRKQRVQWYGFWNKQWYSDFVMADAEADAAAIREVMEVLLVQAEETLLDHLHEPKAPVAPQDDAGEAKTS